MAPKFLGFDHIHVFVQNRSAAEAWYGKVMGFSRTPELEFWSQEGGPLTLQDSDNTVHIALFERPHQKNRATVALRVSAEAFSRWHSHLASIPGVSVSVEDHAVAVSLYFSDPDGNPYEITTYEYAAAKGAP